MNLRTYHNISTGPAHKTPIPQTILKGFMACVDDLENSVTKVHKFVVEKITPFDGHRRIGTKIVQLFFFFHMFERFLGRREIDLQPMVETMKGYIIIHCLKFKKKIFKKKKENLKNIFSVQIS